MLGWWSKQQGMEKTPMCRSDHWTQLKGKMEKMEQKDNLNQNQSWRQFSLHRAHLHISSWFDKRQ